MSAVATGLGALATDLRNWASLGRELMVDRPHITPDWKCFDRLIEVARLKLVGDAERLRQLLGESRKLLTPLQDPFDVDLGLHRWLGEDREEAYSDWLEWVIRQTTDAMQVFRLFDLGAPPQAVIECSQPDIQRECCVPHGHEDRAGRLDLVICYGKAAIIVVEIKKSDADSADTEKHGGYNRWLEEQDYPKEGKHRVLLAPSAGEESYGEFRFVSWASLCVAMRWLARDFAKNGCVMTGAMILAFVAAVEQNLLGFSAVHVRAICESQAGLFNSAVVDHLERFAHSEGG